MASVSVRTQSHATTAFNSKDVKPLLWVEQSGGYQANGSESTARIRQHVMLNFLEKKERRKLNRGQQTADLPRSRAKADLKRPQSYHTNSCTTQETHYDNDIECTTKPTESIASEEPATVAKHPPTIAPASTPTAALTVAADREIHRAAWFHMFQINVVGDHTEPSWKDQCRYGAKRAVWRFAQNDKTLLEMFISFAAAKEAAMKGNYSSKTYELHKARALALLRQDIEREGKSLRLPAIWVVALLCKVAFVEEDYESAGNHARAIGAVVSDRLTAIPFPLWLSAVWADLKLSAVCSQRPLLPYAVHPDMDVRLPLHIRLRSKSLANWNAKDVPRSAFLSDDAAVALLQKLYETTNAYDDDSIDSRAGLCVSYEAAYMLGQLQELPGATECHKGRRRSDRVSALLLAARIQLWGTMSTFFPQIGVQRNLVLEFWDQVSDTCPEDLHELWRIHGEPECLLWVLFNVCVSARHQLLIGRAPPPAMLIWLYGSMRLMIKSLGLGSYAKFEHQLRRWPFTQAWNGNMCSSIHSWAVTGEPMAVPRCMRNATTQHKGSQWTFDPGEGEEWCPV